MSKSNSYEAGMDNDFVSAFTTAIVGSQSLRAPHALPSRYFSHAPYLLPLTFFPFRTHSINGCATKLEQVRDYEIVEEVGVELGREAIQRRKE